MLLSDSSQRSQLCGAGIGEQHIDAALFRLHGGVQSVQVGELADVALNASDVFADLLYCGIEFRLSAPGYEDVCAFIVESLGRGEADSTVAAGDDCYFAFESSAHCDTPYSVRGTR